MAQMRENPDNKLGGAEAADDDFIAEPQVFGGFNSVFVNGNGGASPPATVGIGSAPSRCNAMYPASSFPRFEAGEPLQARSMQCQFRPVTAADYAGYASRNPAWSGATRDADLTTLRSVFPSGVCDYTKPACKNSHWRALGSKSPGSTR